MSKISGLFQYCACSAIPVFFGDFRGEAKDWPVDGSTVSEEPTANTKAVRGNEEMRHQGLVSTRRFQAHYRGEVSLEEVYGAHALPVGRTTVIILQCSSKEMIVNLNIFQSIGKWVPSCGAKTSMNCRHPILKNIILAR